MITDTEARKIASDWHGGQGSALYAFSSTGAIDTARDDHNLYQEISDAIGSIQKQAAQQSIGMPEYRRSSRQLFGIRDYILEHKARGPVEGWSKLTW